MIPETLARYQKEEAVGHRPTWSMGAKRGARPGVDRDETVFAEARVWRRRGSAKAPPYSREPRYNALALRALTVLELDERASVSGIKARYKELVKRFHPDANGGDRSTEDRLREIIQAYNFLKTNRLV